MKPTDLSLNCVPKKLDEYPDKIAVVSMRKNLLSLPSHQLDIDRVSQYDLMKKTSNV